MVDLVQQENGISKTIDLSKNSIFVRIFFLLIIIFTFCILISGFTVIYTLFTFLRTKFFK